MPGRAATKRFKLIEHTADVGGIVYGRDLEELFINAACMLQTLSGVTCVSRGKQIRGRVYVKSDSIESLLVRFLNELIYRIEVKNVFSEISGLDITETGRLFIEHVKKTLPNFVKWDISEWKGYDPFRVDLSSKVVQDYALAVQ